MNRRKEILNLIDTIPSLPSIAFEIQSMLNDPDLDFRDLAEKIKYDPGLTANILSLANSAYFGFTREINSINDAVVLMGTKRIYELIVAESIAPIIRNPLKGYDLSPGQLWKHSVAVAVGAEELTKVLEIKAPDYVFTSGLLHNVGKIILGTYVEIEAELIFEVAAKKGLSFDAAEKEILGIDHAEAGALLLENWGLPKHFIDVANYHHHPVEFTDGESLIIDLIHVADLLAMMGAIGTGKDGMSYKLNQTVVDRLGFDTRMGESIIGNMMVGISNLKSLFNY